MKVRRAQAADVPALVRLVNAAFEAEAPFVAGERTGAVELEARRAKGLFLMAEVLLQAAGRRAVEISVVSERRDLLRFYGALGYAPAGTAPFPRPEALKTPCHFVRMRRSLERDEVRVARGRDRGFVLTTRLLDPTGPGGTSTASSRRPRARSSSTASPTRCPVDDSCMRSW